MKKDFEQAYRELAQNEAPDLWDRIEAGLSEKSAPATVQVRIQVTKPAQQQRRRKLFLFCMKYATLAAALLCIVLLIPVTRTMSRSAGGNSSSDTAAAENGGASTTDTSAQEAPAADDRATGAVGGTAKAQDDLTKYAQTASKAESAAEAPAEVEEARSAAADDMDAGTAANATLQSSADSSAGDEITEAEKMMSDLERLKEDEIISHVIIRVTEINHTELSENIDEFGTLYTFFVEESPSDALSVGEEHVLFVPAYSSYAFMEDGVYEIDMGYRGSEAYSFVLEGYYGEIRK